MIKTLITLITIIILFCNCQTTTNLHQVGRVTILGQKEFCMDGYWDVQYVFQTDDIPWLMVFNSTDVINGTLEDLDPGVKISYDAYNHDWIYDNMGFLHLCYFADKIIILEK